jgi:hypothetical protein
MSEEGATTMKVKINRLFTVAAVGLFSVVASALPAAAREAAKGHFTLPCEVRWQGATLPAGDYTFSFESLAPQTPMVLTGPNGTIFELGYINTSEPSSRTSVLILERHMGVYVVREADLASLGIDIRYNVPKQLREDKELAQQTATDRILVAMVTK